MASIVRAAEPNAFATSPTCLAEAPGCFASSRYSANSSAELRLKAAESSHSTVTSSAAFFAVQKSAASTATPERTDVSNATTDFTPLIAFALVASKLFTLAPYNGAWMTAAVSMPGRWMS